MFRTLALLAIVASVAQANNLWKAGLHSKFDLISGFNAHPRTVADAMKKGYEQVVGGPKVSSGYSALTLWLKASEKNLIGLLFDEKRHIAGIQINVPKTKVTPHYDMIKQGFRPWTHKSVEYWYIRMYFVSEDKETRIASYDTSLVLRDEHLHVQGLGGALEKISTNITKIDSIWKKQACIPFMGQHYYYEMTPTLGCDTPFHPWFLLGDLKTGQLIGMGLMFIGKNDCALENPNLKAVEMIVPNAPQCLYDKVETFGVSTYHFYFNDHPRMITC